jgi:hypothetical protein
VSRVCLARSPSHHTPLVPIHRRSQSQARQPTCALVKLMECDISVREKPCMWWYAAAGVLCLICSGPQGHGRGGGGSDRGGGGLRPPIPSYGRAGRGPQLRGLCAEEVRHRGAVHVRHQAGLDGAWRCAQCPCDFTCLTQPQITEVGGHRNAHAAPTPPPPLSVLSVSS